MGFAWNEFGILTRADEDETYFYIYNDQGDRRKISKYKYRSILDKIREKVQTFMGKSIIFRTSQNTADWSVSEWFSDIRGVDDKSPEQSTQSDASAVSGHKPVVTATKAIIYTVIRLLRLFGRAHLLDTHVIEFLKLLIGAG